MSITNSILSDGRALWHILATPHRGSTHRERLNQFYGGQADVYDSFRKRMLHGRQEMIDSLDVRPQGVWVDMGCGTGENLERFGERLELFSGIYLVDLCDALLDVARRRSHSVSTAAPISIHAADATQFDLPGLKADLVTFSYSLTMIPDWFAAIDNAYRMLKPGGIIGVTDFFVSRKYVDPGDISHGWLTRTGWPIWFAMDNVCLEPDRMTMLRRKFETVSFSQHRGHIAYIPFFKVPYYVFVGRKPDSDI
jgi:S-adenosylmethionine-diacylgycerolhomoserine-N-methlytransferase